MFLPTGIYVPAAAGSSSASGAYWYCTPLYAPLLSTSY